MDVIKEVGPSEAWPDLAGSVATTSGVRPRAIPKPNLQDSDVYLDFSRGHSTLRPFSI